MRVCLCVYNCRALNENRYTDVKLVKGAVAIRCGWRGGSFTRASWRGIGKGVWDRERWIYPGGGSELHFPGHEWQINKQFAFVGNEWWEVGETQGEEK